MEKLLTFDGAVPRDLEIDRWFATRGEPLGAIARHWFELIRRCGNDVRELMHDGCPTACVHDAAFAYVNAYTAHVNVGFFYGAWLPDPGNLLVGSGKRMRHVKLRPETAVDATALGGLVSASYADIQARLRALT